MDVVFADQLLQVRQPSLFLAGPTPRSADVPSWRPEALNLLRGLGFAGTVLVPERRGWRPARSSPSGCRATPRRFPASRPTWSSAVTSARAGASTAAPDPLPRLALHEADRETTRGYIARDLEGRSGAFQQLSRETAARGAGR